MCPGLKLNWHAIEGLSDTLGRNGVTSNYLYHLAPYTWELVQQLRGTAEARQVDGARLALQHNLGLGGACVVTLYERV